MINENIEKLTKQYLFTQIGKIIKERKNVVDLSIGDVKLPLPRAVVEAGIRASAEQSGDGFRGYPPESGYDFLKIAVKDYYAKRNINIDRGEVFVSDGIKSDMNLFFSVLGKVKILIPSPAYPAYIDAATLHGNEVVFYDGFPPARNGDVIIICSPDNPTGRTKSKEELMAWVDYARRNHMLILFDAAYEAYIRSGAPRSIFEIEGARECAVEFCSLSKTAGFTGIRCGYTIVPEECGLGDAMHRIKSCLSNGVSYITQRMAECALTEALPDVMKNVDYYLDNAAIMREALGGADFCGGEDSPYIWLRCGDSESEFFKLLDMYGLGVTPGVGFGESGENHVRINSFCTRDEALIAAQRLKRYVFCK